MQSTPLKVNKKLAQHQIPVLVSYEPANKGLYSVAGGCYRFRFDNDNLRPSGRIPIDIFKRTSVDDLVEWALMWAEGTGNLSEQRRRPLND